MVRPIQNMLIYYTKRNSQHNLFKDKKHIKIGWKINKKRHKKEQQPTKNKQKQNNKTKEKEKEKCQSKTRRKKY